MPLRNCYCRLAGPIVFALGLIFSGSATSQVAPPDSRIPWILADDFELGGLCSWSFAVGGDPGLPICFVCGDGRLDLAEGEQCDDFNTDPGDGCSPGCRFEVCGDGVVNRPNEQCDDGNLTQTDACMNDCQNARCGDGTVRIVFEDCDSGGITNTAACDHDCTSPACGFGDGIVNFLAGEECDDNNVVNGDGCSNLCLFD